MCHLIYLLSKYNSAPRFQTAKPPSQPQVNSTVRGASLPPQPACFWDPGPRHPPAGPVSSASSTCRTRTAQRFPQTPPAAAGARRSGVPVRPLAAQEANVGVLSAFGEFPTALSRPALRPRSRPGRPHPARSRAAPLTVRQLHGASAAQRASQAVELLHRSLHPRGALRAPPAAPAASGPRALHPAPPRPAGGGAGLSRPAPGTERTTRGRVHGPDRGGSRTDHRGNTQHRRL